MQYKQTFTTEMAYFTFQTWMNLLCSEEILYILYCQITFSYYLPFLFIHPRIKKKREVDSNRIKIIFLSKYFFNQKIKTSPWQHHNHHLPTPFLSSFPFWKYVWVCIQPTIVCFQNEKKKKYRGDNTAQK